MSVVKRKTSLSSNLNPMVSGHEYVLLVDAASAQLNNFNTALNTAAAK